ncbi:MAG: hypothetical protein ACHQAU_07470 [Gammaproteobacteria bacterium]
MPDAAQPVTVPMHLDHGVIFFEASVDGQGPFAFILDPGAAGVITSDTIGRLGLHQSAEAAELDISIGTADIGRFALPILPGDGTELYPKRDPAGPLIAGALGPEILNHFALRLDYGANTLTFTALEKFKYQGNGKALPIVFHDVIPLVSASVDGVSGLLAYDIRAPGKVLLFHPFLAQHDFLTRYGAEPDAAHPTVPETLHSLEVAGVVLKDQPANFGGFTDGKFAATDEAGLLGYQVLSQFVTTLDYRDRLIYFEHP